MRGTLLAITAVAVVTGAIVGATTPSPGGRSLPGALIGLAIGTVAGAAVSWLQRRRLRGVAEEVRRWLADGAPERRDRRVSDPALRDLEKALALVGAELDERSLARQRRLRAELVEALSSPALVFDTDDGLVTANPAAQELLGLPQVEEGMSLLQTLGNVALAEAVADAGGGEVQLDVDLVTRHVHAVVSRVGADTLVVLTDRTRERRVEELRRDFVVNASHELKTPAAAIQALSEALEITAAKNPERVADLVARLRSESERLVRLVHDLLSLRRLEDRPALDASDVDLSETVREIVGELDSRARARGISIELDLPARAPMVAEADDVRLIVRNLVANALQYNQEGGEVRVELRRDGGTWMLQVADTGIGIPQAELSRIFERFYRVDVARSRQTGGTGLGLSIVRHAVERHGGSIEVDSLLGQGTTFQVWLPVTPS